MATGCNAPHNVLVYPFRRPLELDGAQLRHPVVVVGPMALASPELGAILPDLALFGDHQLQRIGLRLALLVRDGGPAPDDPHVDVVRPPKATAALDAAATRMLGR